METRDERTRPAEDDVIALCARPCQGFGLGKLVTPQTGKRVALSYFNFFLIFDGLRRNNISPST